MPNTLRGIAVQAVSENRNPIQALVQSGLGFDEAVLLSDSIWREGLALKVDQLGNGLLTAAGRQFLLGGRP